MLINDANIWFINVYIVQLQLVRFVFARKLIRIVGLLELSKFCYKLTIEIVDCIVMLCATIWIDYFRGR